jgi:hypothetical protein
MCEPRLLVDARCRPPRSGALHPTSLFYQRRRQLRVKRIAARSDSSLVRCEPDSQMNVRSRRGRFVIVVRERSRGAAQRSVARPKKREPPLWAAAERAPAPRKTYIVRSAARVAEISK